MIDKLLISISRQGSDRYGVTIEDKSLLCSVNEVNENVEIIEFGDFQGVLVRNEWGLYGSDIKTTGALWLVRLEDQFGNILPCLH